MAGHVNELGTSVSVRRVTTRIPIAAFAVTIGAVLWGCTDARRSFADSTPGTAIGTLQSALTTCSSFGASGDATLSNPPMNGNFGTQPILRAGGKDEGLVRFNLGTIPSSAVVDRATLELYVSGSGSDAPVNVHRATSAWDESTVSYTSFGQHFDAAVLGSVVVTNPNVQKSVDITSLVTSWVTGAQPNFGVLLEASSTNKKTIFVSREGGIPEQEPALEVCYTVPDDHCSPDPCQNGATCENGTSGYGCHCAAGYTGANCETLIDDCASAPCLNGATCTSGVNSYSCTCAAGFTGTNCEINIDDCANQPCLNGGVCQDGVASYSCSCPPGYSGANCETLIDDCASAPCLNGATCTSGVNSYSCTCAAGFTGTNCEINIDDCANQPCLNGGTCLDGVTAYTCVCPPDWGGANCAINLNTCSQNPCLNGSTCTNGYGTYTCTCAPGFSGANCEIDINDCAPNPCLNGGVCVDGVNQYTCACAAGFSGSNCETASLAVPTFTAGLTVTPNVVRGGESTSGLLRFALPTPSGAAVASVSLTASYGGDSVLASKSGGGALTPADLGTVVAVDPPTTVPSDRKTFTYSLTAANSLGASSSPVTASLSVFPASVSLAGPRVGGTGTLLPNGKVLLAGGGSGISHGVCAMDSFSKTAELYDPVSGTSTPVSSSLVAARCRQTAILVGTKVYLMGGADTAKVDVYDSAQNSFQNDGVQPLPTLQVKRTGHTATLLGAASVTNSGKIVVAGGYSTTTGLPLPSLELFDPAGASGNGSSTLYAGSLPAGRAEHSATLVGRWLVFIGGLASTSVDSLDTSLSTSVSNPLVQTVTPVNAVPRLAHAAAPLSATSILVAGGVGSDSTTLLASMQTYTVNPSTGLVTAGAVQMLATARARFGLVSVGLPNKYLAVGGTVAVSTTTAPDTATPTIEQIDTSSALVASPFTPLAVARQASAVVDIAWAGASNTIILVAGGASSSTAGAELVIGP